MEEIELILNDLDKSLTALSALSGFLLGKVLRLSEIIRTNQDRFKLSDSKNITCATSHNIVDNSHVLNDKLESDDLQSDVINTINQESQS